MLTCTNSWYIVDRFCKISDPVPRSTDCVPEWRGYILVLYLNGSDIFCQSQVEGILSFVENRLPGGLLKSTGKGKLFKIKFMPHSSSHPPPTPHIQMYNKFLLFEPWGGGWVCCTSWPSQSHSLHQLSSRMEQQCSGTDAGLHSFE